MASDKTKTNKF